MTYEEAVRAYTDKWGGVPFFLLMSMTEEEKISILQQAIDSGKQIEPVTGRIY